MASFTVPNVKVDMTIVFGATGWTESHYSVGATDLANSALISQCTALCRQRSSFLDPQQASIIDCRMSIDSVNRDAIHLDASLLPVAGVNGYPGQNSSLMSYSNGWNWQTPQVSWPVIFRTSQTTTRPIVYLAGFLASDGQKGPLPTDDSAPTVYDFMTPYLSLLTSGPWGCKARQWPSADRMVVNATPVWVVGANGQSATIRFPLANFSNSPYLVPGGYVRLQNASYTSVQKRLRLNGTYTIASVDPTATPPSLTVFAPRVLISPVFTGLGYLQVATPAVLQYQAPWSARKITHKKRGRVTEAPRGRR